MIAFRIHVTQKKSIKLIIFDNKLKKYEVYIAIN